MFTLLLPPEAISCGGAASGCGPVEIGAGFDGTDLFAIVDIPPAC